jgi:hypothetical protein
MEDILIHRLNPLVKFPTKGKKEKLVLPQCPRAALWALDILF